MRRVPVGPFSIRRVPVGPAVTHPWRLQFVIIVSARSFLHAMCTCGTLLHPTCTCGTCSYSFVTLAIRHRNLRSVLSPSDEYLRDPSASDLWDPMAYVSRVPMGLYSISIWPVGHDGLLITCTYGTIWPVGPNDSHVTCTCGTILHLHLTCGTWRFTCHLTLAFHYKSLRSVLSPSDVYLRDPSNQIFFVNFIVLYKHDIIKFIINYTIQ